MASSRFLSALINHYQSNKRSACISSTPTSWKIDCRRLSAKGFQSFWVKLKFSSILHMSSMKLQNKLFIMLIDWTRDRLSQLESLKEINNASASSSRDNRIESIVPTTRCFWHWAWLSSASLGPAKTWQITNSWCGNGKTRNHQYSDEINRFQVVIYHWEDDSRSRLEGSFVQIVQTFSLPATSK